MIDQTRLEKETTGRGNPNKPRRKPFGRTFWALLAVFMLVGSALATFLMGYLFYNAVASDEAPERPALQAPAEKTESRPEPAGDSPADQSPAPDLANPEDDPVYQDESGVWRNTNRGENPGPQVLESAPTAPPEPAEAQSPPDLMSLGLKMLAGAGRGQTSAGAAPAKVAQGDQFYQDENGVWRNTGSGAQSPSRSEHLYQDENGVWRNLSLRTGPESATPAPVAANPMAALMGGLLGQSGEAAQADGNPMAALMGGLLGQGGGADGNPTLDLLGSLLGGGSGGDGPDLMSQLGGLMSGSGGESSLLGGDLGSLMSIMSSLGGDSPVGGDLSSVMGLLTGSGGNPSQGDLTEMLNLLNGMGASTGAGGRASMAEEIAPLNITRARPQVPGAARPAAAEITNHKTGLNIEGYERFDPATAGEIKSDWEFFEDPR